MEHKKDISIKDTESRLTGIALLKDKDISFALKKTEKILAATYLLTRTFPVQEELRWSMRHSGNSLLRDIHHYAESTTHAMLSLRLEESSLHIHSLISLLRVSVIALYISEMNAEILTHELFKLHDTLSAYVAKNPLSNVTLGKSFFDTEVVHTEEDIQSSEVKEVPAKKHETHGLEKHVLYKGHAKGHNVLERIAAMHSSYETHNGHNVTTSNQSGNEFKKDITNERQTMIIEYLRHNKVLTIKDVSSFIKGCSEKTIQRDLVDLIRNGVLKKVGERRWSKYFLV